ncbi:MAG: extracellular solute-binding protein [Lentisphaeria bacterium]|nr:extracellular solute-binding protein [Lentisphaeria bacterium]
MLLRRLVICFILFAALLAVPFYFRKTDGVPPVEDGADRLVIISAHNKSVRDEYEIAFRKHYKARFGKDIVLDFRSPGGTSDIVRYIEDSYTAKFRQYCEEKNIPWKSEYADIFRNPTMASHPIRKAFLESDVSIGIDVFAGGGTFNHDRLAKRGYAVDGKVKERHPEYFAPGSMPQNFGGDVIYDPLGRYYGVVLTTFGMLYNIDRMQEMADPTPPVRWKDIGDARFFRQVIVADPSKSGSANKCFEIILQQCMAEAGEPVKGWYNGINLLKRIFANARTITDSASKVVRDVGIGEGAVGTAIDTYGFTEVEWSEKIFNGRSRVVYVTPKGGTAVSSDPVQILRGAPNRKAAEEFVDFLLSIEGQKLHAFKVGTPGGAVKASISRPAVRRELYAPEYRKYLFQPDYDPYKSGADFKYRPQWTGRYYSLLQMVIKSIMLDTHLELQRAWEAIIAAGGPEAVPEAMKYFNALPFSYKEASAAAAKLRKGNGRSAADVAAELRKWNDFARENYRKAEKLAREKR